MHLFRVEHRLLSGGQQGVLGESFATAVRQDRANTLAQVPLRLHVGPGARS